MASLLVLLALWNKGMAADPPGTAHRITVPDLPRPYATGSTSNSASVAARPSGAVPQAPPGFAVTLFASGLDLPRAIRRAPDGTIFVAESGAGAVRLFPARGGAGSVFASGLTLPFGIAFWPPADPRFVYVADTDGILRFPYRSGDQRTRGPAESIAPLPTGGHWTRDLVAAPDASRIYVAVGSGSNVAGSMAPKPPMSLTAWEEAHGRGAAWGAETGRAAVLSLDPRTGNLRPFATGLRNCVGLAIEPATTKPWCATNERDGLGDDLPPDYATSVAEGGFYGWPWYYIGGHEDPRLRGRRPDLAEDVRVPDVLIQPHSAPLGITFYDRDAFPPDYRGEAFVALHGSWNRSVPTGYKVVRLRFRDGRPTGAYEDFLTGFETRPGTVWGRPVGVAVTDDGALLVTEDADGTIWRVTYAK